MPRQIHLADDQIISKEQKNFYIPSLERKMGLHGLCLHTAQAGNLFSLPERTELNNPSPTALWGKGDAYAFCVRGRRLRCARRSPPLNKICVREKFSPQVPKEEILSLSPQIPFLLLFLQIIVLRTHIASYQLIFDSIELLTILFDFDCIAVRESPAICYR